MGPQGIFFHVRNEHQRDVAIKAIQARETGKSGFFVQLKSSAPRRSEIQNAFMWGWVYREIARQLEDGGIVIPLDDGGEHPYTADVLHEIFREKFLVTGEIRNARGRTLKLYASTAKMSKKEFNQYIEQVKKFCRQLWHIEVDPPDRGIWHEYYRVLEQATDQDTREPE